MMLLLAPELLEEETAEGVSVIVLGKQEGAPLVDLHLVAESR